MILALATPEDTHALGLRIGRSVSPGVVLALIGELGAGKTALVRGLAAGLGVPTRIQSPTFGLVHPHEGRLPLWHADWYRLNSEREAAELGLIELAEPGVLAIEWADRYPALLPADRLEIRLAEQGDGRVARIEATGPSHRALAGLLAGAIGDGG